MVPSFLIPRMVVHFSVGEVICLVIYVDERDCGKNHQVQTQQGLRALSSFSAWWCMSVPIWFSDLLG